MRKRCGSPVDRYREAADQLRAAGRFYECFETPVELDLKRKKLLNMGRPPVYDRAALSLTEEQQMLVDMLQGFALEVLHPAAPAVLHAGSEPARPPVRVVRFDPLQVVVATQLAHLFPNPFGVGADLVGDRELTRGDAEFGRPRAGQRPPGPLHAQPTIVSLASNRRA